MDEVDLFVQMHVPILTWRALNRSQTCVEHFSIYVPLLAVVETPMMTAVLVHVFPSFARGLWAL